MYFSNEFHVVSYASIHEQSASFQHSFQGHPHPAETIAKQRLKKKPVRIFRHHLLRHPVSFLLVNIAGLAILSFAWIQFFVSWKPDPLSLNHRFWLWNWSFLSSLSLCNESYYFMFKNPHADYPWCSVLLWDFGNRRGL